ncbi:MAG: hypothetical protein K2X74_09275, partial [Acetobacteraceae bacterium]|nr:hypothetical protein [Acetobacteraceae bacterium]
AGSVINGGTQFQLTIPTSYNGAFAVHVAGATFAPQLQIVPVVTAVDVTSTNFAQVTGQGLVEGNGTAYQFGNGSVIDVDTGTTTNVFSSGTASNLTLPIQGIGNFTVTTTGGTSAPIAWNVVNPNLGSLIGVAYDPATSTLWVADGANISRVSKATGVVLGSFPNPQATSFIGLQFVATGFTLNGVAVPAGSLLVTSGVANPDRFVAMNATTGAVIAQLAVSANFDFIAGVYHAGRNTLFGLDGSPDQLIEINPATGATVNTFALAFDVQSGGLSIDAVGNIWMATSGGSIIRRFNVATNTVDQTIDLAKDSISTELTGLATEAPGFVVGSSNRGVVYFQLDPPVGDVPAPTVAMESPVVPIESPVSVPSVNLELAYVQQAWVKDFVTGSAATMADKDQDEELVIALPA